MQAAHEAAVQQAIDDGVITADQAEQLQNGGMRGFGGRGGHHGFGGRGGFGGPGSFEGVAPTTGISL